MTASAVQQRARSTMGTSMLDTGERTRSWATEEDAVQRSTSSHVTPAQVIRLSQRPDARRRWAAVERAAEEVSASLLLLVSAERLMRDALGLDESWVEPPRLWRLARQSDTQVAAALRAVRQWRRLASRFRARVLCNTVAHGDLFWRPRTSEVGGGVVRARRWERALLAEVERRRQVAQATLRTLESHENQGGDSNA